MFNVSDRTKDQTKRVRILASIAPSVNQGCVPGDVESFGVRTVPIRSHWKPLSSWRPSCGNSWRRCNSQRFSSCHLDHKQKHLDIVDAGVETHPVHTSVEKAMWEYKRAQRMFASYNFFTYSAHCIKFAGCFHFVIAWRFILWVDGLSIPQQLDAACHELMEMTVVEDIVFCIAFVVKFQFDTELVISLQNHI